MIDIIFTAICAGAVGYLVGIDRSLTQGRVDTCSKASSPRNGPIIVEGKHVSVTIDMEAVLNVLDRQGLCAVPKGVDWKAEVKH